MTVPTEDPTHPPRPGRRWRVNLLLAGLGIGFAGLLALGALALFPQLQPDMIAYTAANGDLFIHEPGWIKPPDDPYAPLAVYRYVRDDLGFRVSAQPADHYDVLALGDSYTHAANVAYPWPDVLARDSGLAVRNMGIPGYGPVEEADVMETFGVDVGAETVVVGYFEGNDLSNAMSVEWAGYQMPPEVWDSIEANDDIPWDPNYTGPFKYPMTIVLNGQRIDYVVAESYLWWLNATPDVYVPSLNVDNLLTSWGRIQAAAGDACVIIAYLPSKPHIYTRYLAAEDIIYALESSERLIRNEDGVLVTRPEREIGEPSTYEEVLSRIDNQRDVIAGLAADMGLPFVDTTPAFEAAAAQGEYLYYTYDTHWNQAGHDLAGQVIADFLATDPCG